jgi:hypothetical protein
MELTKENAQEGLLPKPIVYQMVVKYKAMTVNTILFFIKKLSDSRRFAGNSSMQESRQFLAVAVISRYWRRRMRNFSLAQGADMK